MQTAVEYLKGARKELEAGRAEIDRQIAVLDRTLAELTGQPTPGAAAADVATSDGEANTPRSIRDIAIALAEEHDEFTIAQVLEIALNEGNDSKYQSVSSILSRLSKEKVLMKGSKRGSYRRYDAATAQAQATAAAFQKNLTDELRRDVPAD